MINVILQPLGLELVNINGHAKVYQTIPNGLRVVGIFSKLSGDTQLHKLSGNGQHTTAQTVRGRTRAIIGHTLNQSSASLSVVFLRVVQYSSVYSNFNIV